MDAWKPLAPVSLSSAAKYAPAPSVSSPSSFRRQPAVRSSAGPSRYERYADDAEDASTSGDTAEAKRASGIRAYTQALSDPFPPIGPLPRAVAVRILGFLTIGEQTNCALSGRAFAGAVADESNWRRRLDALSWCNVDGLQVHFDPRDGDAADSERSIGRRRKGKARAVDPANGAHKQHNDREAPPERGKIAPAVGTGASEDDDFGDFAAADANSKADDLFGDVPFDRAKPAGGSLASGLASVALGGGKPHSFGGGPTSMAPLIPTKLGKPNVGSASSSASKAQKGAIFSFAAEARLPKCDASPSYRILRAYAKALRPFLKSLADTSGPARSSLLFTCDLGLVAQAALLSNILRFISADVGGNSSSARRRRDSLTSSFEEEDSLTYRGQEAAQHLLQTLLASFQGTSARRSDAVRAATHGADTARAIRRAEDDMRSHAHSVWELGSARLVLALGERDAQAHIEADEFGRMEAAEQFLGQLDVFVTAPRAHSPLDNVRTKKDDAVLDFTAMDRFIADLSETVRSEGAIIMRVFPPDQDVLLAFADRLATQVVGKYIRSLLDHTQSFSTHTYLRSCAATFAQAWNLVDALLSVESRQEDIVTRPRCEDVIYRMWEENVDEYLPTERSWVTAEMQKVTEKWETDVRNEAASANVNAAFLTSQNPAAVKRSVLTGFKDVLLLPVTTVPRAVGTVGGAVIRTAGTGLSTLNPLRWQSGSAASIKAGADISEKPARSPGLPSPGAAHASNPSAEKGYIDFSNGAIGGPDSDDDDDEHPDEQDARDEWNEEVAAWSSIADARTPARKSVQVPKRPKPLSIASSTPPRSSTPTTAAAASTRASTPSAGGVRASLAQMQMLLSLDTALQVIHVNRDCMKRVETFKNYPSPVGERVRAEIQEVSLMLFRALGEGHIAPGFREATKRIVEYDPKEAEASADHNEKAEHQQVEPLVHFFELVHVGDTIAQMVQVYFEEEMGRHIDKNDFMNPVVKGKKRFESNLDEAVAKGLNAGVDLLLGQCEHILTTKQTPRDFNPDKGLTDLSPTQACREVVECLRIHCRMLVGSTDKHVLEVFYQEVGIRLHGIICKHLKRQVVSLDGGFRLIADLNDYHAFIATLRQPMVTADFDALKMLGNLYIIDNPRELAKLARDANNFGGTLSPEDLYEFLQARADFRHIEKAVDKEMYGFKVSEDCTVA